jgi:2-hydroxy-6-oxonona-2,4-dienedioate hydrolase
MASDEASYRSVEQRLWESFGLEPTEQRVHLQNLNVTVRVQEIGEGPAVVLIHGASVAGTSWVNLVKGLAEFRCIMLDRPGCGLSDPMPGAAGTADIDAVKRAADHLIPDLLDALELPTAHVLGTSFGGFFALRAAAAAPRRVDRVMLYSWSMGVPMDHTPLVMRVVAGIPAIGQITARLPMTRAAAKMMLRQVGLRGAIDSGTFNAEMLDWFVALMRYTPTLRNEIRATPRMIRPIKGLNQAMLFTDEMLARVTTPVHCFWGEDDPNGGAATAKQFVTRLPDCTLELVPAAGHAPWIDKTELATASTRTFLNG